MNKFWLVFRHEYLRHVLTKRFIFGVLSIPMIIAISIGFGLLSVVLGIDNRPVGIVDHAGIFSEPIIIPQPDNGPIPETSFIFYKDPEEASTALEREDIQGYYTLEADYMETGKVILTAPEAPGSEVLSDFTDLLKANLIKNQPAEISMRLLEGPQITVKALYDERAAGESNILGIILPLVAGIMFIISVNISGGYLLQAVVEEKENRTMEIILTSVSTDQLMAGKITGNLSVGLTQLFIWLAAAGIGLLFFLQTQPQQFDFSVAGSFMGAIALMFLPAFVMIAALMAMVGATATEAREAQQIAGVFTIPIFIPLWFLGAILENPNSPLAIGFSIFPFTSPLTMPMRIAFSTVPAWQIGLSFGLLVAAAAGSLWLASRAFRLGMLRYGKKLPLRELFQRAG